MRLGDNFSSSFPFSYGFNRDVEYRLYVASSILLDISPLRFGRGFKAEFTMPDMSSCVSDVGTYSKIRGARINVAIANGAADLDEMNSAAIATADKAAATA